METYTIIAPCLGHTIGAEVTYEPDDVKSFLDAGKMVRKNAKAQAQADATITNTIDTLAGSLLDKVIDSFNAQAKAAGRLNVTVPTADAEPKEEETLREWLHLMAGQAQIHSNPGLAGYSKGMLQNKYKAKVNPDFGKQFQGAVSKGAGGLGATQKGFQDTTESKASVQVESVGGLGGLTVPTQFAAEFFKLADPMSIFLSRVRRFTMTNRELWIPAIDYSKGGSGASPYLGGMNAGWTGENTAFPQQNANVAQIKLVANLLGGYTQSSRQLLADSPVALEQVMTSLFAQAIAFNCDYAIFTGDGIDKPKGMTKAASAYSFTRGTWATNGLLLADLATADASILPEYEGQYLWLVPPSFKKNLYPMANAAGGLAFLPNFPGTNSGPAAVRPTMALFGKDLFFSQLPVTAATAGSVNIVAPQLYAFGVRDELEIAVSEHFAWTSNLLTWRFLFRGAGQSLINSQVTLQNGDIVSPAVSIN